MTAATHRATRAVVGYADRMSRVQPSAIRELLRLGTDPDIVSFGGGYPDPALFPIEELHQVYADLLDAGPCGGAAVHGLERVAAAADPGCRTPHPGRHARDRGRRADHPGRSAGSRSGRQAGDQHRRRDHHREPHVPGCADRVRPHRAAVCAGALRRRRDGHRPSRGGAGRPPGREDDLHRARLRQPERYDVEPAASAPVDRAGERVRTAGAGGHAVPAVAVRGGIPAHVEESGHGGSGAAPGELLQDPGARGAAGLGDGESGDPRTDRAAEARGRHPEQHA